MLGLRLTNEVRAALRAAEHDLRLLTNDHPRDCVCDVCKGSLVLVRAILAKIDEKKEKEAKR